MSKLEWHGNYITPKVDSAVGYKSELGNMIMWCRTDMCVAKDVRVQMTAHRLACIKPHPLFMHAWEPRYPKPRVRLYSHCG